MATFVVKHPRRDSTMFLHDDRTYVDETRFRASTIWIPFVSVGPAEMNGGLEVVPRSHRLPTGPSGSLTPDRIRPYEEFLRTRLEPLEVPVGSAVVYDTRLLHSSAANLSDRPRLALVCAVAPRDAELIHVVSTGRRRRAVHRVDEQFFLDLHPRVVEAGLSGRYPASASLVDPDPLDAERVAKALGVQDLPEPRPVVPEDITIDHLAPSAFGAAVCDERWPAPDDLPVTSTTLGGSSMPDTIEVTDAQGSWSIGPIGGLPAGLIVGVRPDVPVILLDRGARVALRIVGTAGEPFRATVVESDLVGAGMASGGQVVAAEPGRGVEVEAQGEWTLWNDGAGSLVVVVERILPEPRVGGIRRRWKRWLARRPASGRGRPSRISTWTGSRPDSGGPVTALDGRASSVSSGSVARRSAVRAGPSTGPARPPSAGSRRSRSESSSLAVVAPMWKSPSRSLSRLSPWNWRPRVQRSNGSPRTVKRAGG